jgi:hypothetical protein
MTQSKAYAPSSVVTVVCGLLITLSITTQTQQSSATMSEAELHFRVAVAAIKDSNFKMALASLEKAAALAPRNGLIHYNLAIVLEKLNQPERGLENVRKAISLGVPPANQEAANDLLARLTYLKEKISGDVQKFAGTWVSKQTFDRVDESCSYTQEISRSLAIPSVATTQIEAHLERRAMRSWRHGTRFSCGNDARGRGISGQVDNSVIIRSLMIDTSSGTDAELLFGRAYVRAQWYRGEQRVVSCKGYDCDADLKKIEDVRVAIIGRDLIVGYDVGTAAASQVVYRKPGI